MLVLSRKPGETIKIGDDITVTVLSVRGKTLRLGIEAPRESRVLRGELQDWHGDRADVVRRTLAVALSD